MIKNTVFPVLAALFFLFVLPAPYCAGIRDAIGGADFSEAQGRDWFLSEVASGSGIVIIDRKGAAAGFGETYTLRFDEERLSGMGAPNRYFAPYASGEGNSLSIGMVAGTLMAPLFENENLKESEYFAYLGKARRWELRNGKLNLYSSSIDGGEAVLVFLPKE